MRVAQGFLTVTGLMLGLLAWAVPADAKGPLPFELVISDQQREIRISPQEFAREVSGATGYLYGVLDPSDAPTSPAPAAYQLDFYLYSREELTAHGWVARTVYQGPGPDRQRMLWIRLAYYSATGRSPAIARVESSRLSSPYVGQWLKPTPELEGLISRSITVGKWIPKSVTDNYYAGGWWPVGSLSLACTALLAAWLWRRGLSRLSTSLAIGTSGERRLQEPESLHSQRHDSRGVRQG